MKENEEVIRQLKRLNDNVAVGLGSIVIILALGFLAMVILI